MTLYPSDRARFHRMTRIVLRAPTEMDKLEAEIKKLEADIAKMESGLRKKAPPAPKAKKPT